MPTANGRKGSETERMVAKYLREQGFWMAERRLKEGRRDDQGDIDGVPYTTIQVKYVARPALQAWVTATLKQRDNAGTELCLLVVRVKHKPVAQWDAYMPMSQMATWVPGSEQEAWTWVRTDLRLAVALIKKAQEVDLSIPSAPSSFDMWTGSTRRAHERPVSSAAPSTGSGTPPSPTT